MTEEQKKARLFTARALIDKMKFNKAQSERLLAETNELGNYVELLLDFPTEVTNEK